jgi:TusA-related sulfurtransferase
VELRPEQDCLENPIVQFQRAIQGLGPGEVLEVITHGADHTFAVKALAQRGNLLVVGLEETGPGARIYLQGPAGP